MTDAADAVKILDPLHRAVRGLGLRGPLPLSVTTDLAEAQLHAGRVLTREQLEQQIYRWGDEVESNAIEVHVHHLRRKLGAALIQTVRGVGYLVPRPGGAPA